MGEANVTTVTGNCALHDERYHFLPVSEASIGAALGPGHFTARGDVFSDDTAPATCGVPVSGECDYLDDDGVRRIAFGLDNRALPYSSWDNARRVQRDDGRATPLPGVDGYLIVEDVTDLDGSVAQQAVAVLFDGDRLVSVDILVPSTGVDSGARAEELVREALASFSKPMASAAATIAGAES